MSERFRTVVCGTNFGRFYAQAVRDHPAFDLAGIVSTGSDHSRRYAGELRVPLYTSLEELPSDVTVACVVVPGAVAGGRGTEVALQLIDRGVHVLQEHPLHPDELAACLRAARRSGVQYRLNTHYRHLAPVGVFLDAAARLRAQQPVLFADVATSVHVLQPLVDILARAVGGVRPWSFSAPSQTTPLRVLHGRMAGVPVSLRVQNQLHPGDRDNHALFWHRVAIGTEGGVLTLADTHGPVLWQPRLHAPRDADRRLLHSPVLTPALGLPTTSVLGPAQQPTYAEAFRDLWPAAIGAALTELAEAVAARADPLRAGQRDLSLLGAWQDLASRLGPPELISPGPPRVLSAAEIGPPPPPVAVTHDGYTGSAEFFDLAARQHAEISVPAVLAGLAGVDTSAGPILDVGAGTGLITVAVGRALPDAEIVAAEPSPAMRAVLTSRIDDDPGFRGRVSVRADPAGDLDLPERLSAAVLCGVLGHLDRPERTDLLARITARMPAGAPVVVELMGMSTPITMPATRMVTRELGEHRYEWWVSGAPIGPELMRLDTVWRVYRDGELVREVHDSYPWRTFSVAELAAECGLKMEPLPAPHMGVLRTRLTT